MCIVATSLSIGTSDTADSRVEGEQVIDCKHYVVIGHEHGAWCQECGEQVGGSMLREPVTITKEQFEKFACGNGTGSTFGPATR